jgi:uncharacterized membrane protein YgcG
MTDRERSAFADRVMTAIEAVPGPTPVRTFGWSLRAGAWRDAVTSLLVAWHLGTVRTWPVAPRVRARSMALVLAVASVLATGSIVAAAAVRVAVPGDDRVPPIANPASNAPSGPIVDGPAVDESDGDLVRVPPSRPAEPGAAETEPTPAPSRAPAHGPRATDHAGRTTRPGGDAAEGDHEGAGSHDAGDGTGADRTDDGGTQGTDGGDPHDGSGDSGRDGVAGDDGGSSDGGGDSSDGGTD